MKKITFSALTVLITSCVFSQSITTQKKISDYPTRNLKTGFVLGYSGTSTYKYPVSVFAADKVDSITVGYGPVFDTLWSWKEGQKVFFKLTRASTTGGTIAAPTAPTPATGDNSTRIATTAALIAERTATATVSGKTISGSTNTLVNIPYTAIPNIAADLAARVTLQQLRDSLNALDTSRTFEFVNIGMGSGAFGIFENVAGNKVNALSLIGGGGTTISRVGNNLVITSSSTPGTFDYGANNTWTGTNTFNNTVTVNGDFTIGGAPLRIWGVPTTPSAGVTRTIFGDAANRFEYSGGNPLDAEFYHGIAFRSDALAAGPAVKATTGNASRPALTMQAAPSQATWIWNWTNSAGTVLGGVSAAGYLIEPPPPVYADNTAALAAGLETNRKYRTSDGTLKVVF